MLNRRHFLTLLLALPLLLSGCRIETINYFPPKAAHVRFVNVVPNATALNVTVDGTATWSSQGFEAMTPYMDFTNETHNFTTTVAGATTTLTQANFNLAGNSFYTLIAFGPAHAAGLVLLSDDTVTPTAGKLLLRVANMSGSVGPIDIYLTTPGADLTNATPNIGGIFYGGATGFIQVSSGNQQLRITQSGTKNVVYDSGARNFSDNTATDAIVYTRTGGPLVNVALSDINGAGQNVIVNSTMTELKVVNAALQTGAVNQLLDGTVLVPNLAYPTAFSGTGFPNVFGYNIISPGSHTITFEAAAAPGATIASVTTTLAAASDTTVFVTGFAGATTAVVLKDQNFSVINNDSRLRLVNASPDTPAVDVSLNDTKQVSALAFPTASGYLQQGGGAYKVTFTNPATGAVVLNLDGVVLGSGTNTTIYLVGAAGQFGSIVTRDY
ncbi:MAG: DUF4397 domain-containing protein [Vicinamibacterales bacterium]